MKSIVRNTASKMNENRCDFLPGNEPQKLPEEDHSTLVVWCDRSMIEMQFCLKQQDDSHEAKKNSSLIQLPLQSHSIRFPGIKGTILCSSILNTHTKKLHIRFNLTFIEAVTCEDCLRTIQRLRRISCEEFIDARKRGYGITPQMRVIINELLCCDKAGTVERLFWQSKILELLMLQVEQIENATRPVSSIKYYDIEKLEEAKSIVENNLATPYSLKTLAHKVGLNDFKLKRGFKELFGYTVFGYLRELRMQLARKLLMTAKDSVTDVSGEVGYQHPHHFSAAFKRRFGILPGTLNK